MTIRKLLYFADPMCSWCWGFSPVIQQISEKYSANAPVSIHLGGLRAGNTQVMDDQQRQYILNHWFSVNEASGQPFEFSFNMPDGFIYDTEPACRAIKTMQQLNDSKALDYFSAIQQSFYAENKDVTQTANLCDLAAGFDVDQEIFKQAFLTDELRQKTRNDFILSQQFGVNGFPTLIGQADQEYVYITQGFALFEQLVPRVDKSLADHLSVAG